MQISDFYKFAVLDEKMWYFRSVHRRLNFWVDQLISMKTANLLDCGCGTGGLIKFLNKKRPFWKIIGLDISQLACRISKSKTQALFTVASIESLPFIENYFEVVVVADTICQIELARVTKPGGFVLINEPALSWLWSFHDEAFMTKHRFNKKELINMARASNLQPLLVSYVNFFLFPLFLLRRKIFRQEIQKTMSVYIPGR
jgi:ubiquinone/menaquinone biosynthesis C-methylase UbiE